MRMDLDGADEFDEGENGEGGEMKERGGGGMSYQLGSYVPEIEMDDPSGDEGKGG